MNNKGTNAYTIRNFRRVKKNAYTRIACVYFASALFAYLRAALYPIQSQWTYFKKLSCYSILMAVGFNNSFLNWVLVNSFQFLGFPYKEYFISLLRAFPGGVTVNQLQQQPSAMLLRFMLYRLRRISDKDFRCIKLKGDFVSRNLPGNVFVPGMKADRRSYWLFPLVVDNPDEVVRELEREGVEAYRGATQLSTVFRTQHSGEDIELKEKPKEYKTCNAETTFPRAEVAVVPSSAGNSWTTHENLNSLNMSSAEFVCSAPVAAGSNQASNSFRKEKDDVLFPHNAKYLIDHVLYLPVHKRVPYWYLEHICFAVEKIMKNRKGVKIEDAKNVLFKSKL